MANANGWGDGASNNNIGWGKGSDNAIGWGAIHADSWAGLTDIVGTPAVDPDAQAFITAASITDPTQQSAINQLVVDLKGYGIWTKMKAVYPFVGGTASQHKWNLKDPRDLDAAFRLVFCGGITHSSNGATPNGTNGYANTFVNTLNNLGANSAHLAYYSRTNSAVANEIPMGNLNASSGASGLNLVIRRTSDVNSFRATDATTNGIVSSTVTDSRGLFIGSITSATSRKTYKNSSVLNTLTTNYTWDRANFNLYLAAANDILSTNAIAYTNKETAFASIGDGLLDSEANNLYLCVQQFNTTLGRQV